MPSGKRFERLTEEIGDTFIKVELPGPRHSTVTEHRSQEAVDAVLEFFAEKLHGLTAGTEADAMRTLIYGMNPRPGRLRRCARRRYRLGHTQRRAVPVVVDQER